MFEDTWETSSYLWDGVDQNCDIPVAQRMNLTAFFDPLVTNKTSVGKKDELPLILNSHSAHGDTNYILKLRIW